MVRGSGGNFVFDSPYMRFNKDDSLEVKGSGADKETGAQLDAKLKLVPSTEWNQDNSVVILGMVDREYIEPQDGTNNSARPPRANLPAAKSQKDNEPDWSSVSSTPWLRHMKPANVTGMENKYVIVADTEDNKIAILGLCRKVAA
jgi:hypothetical protein